MRRIPVVFAVTALAAVGLVGCSGAVGTSSGAAASCDRPSAASGVSNLVEVTGATDEAPEVEVRTPFHVDETTAFDLVVGDGEVVTEEAQMVALDISLVSGATGEPLVATGYDPEAIQSSSLTQWSQTFPDLPEALECATAGSRVVVALAPEGIEPQALEGLGLEEGESAIAVVDLRKVFLPRADGADQYSDARGLPSVVRAPDGRPGIIVPEASAPTSSVVQVLKKGDGPVVTTEESVVVQFASAEWDDPKTSAQSTWDAEPQVLTFDAVPPEISDALVGQTVGSQVLVVLPAAEGQSGSAMVYVFDILGIDG